ncbi:MAG: M23 family metallopeptidase [Patescibacteria group bacterium]
MREYLRPSVSTFADESLDFGGGVIVSSTSDIEHFNSLPDSGGTLELRESKPRDKKHFSKRVLVLANLVPKPLQKSVEGVLLLAAAGLSTGAVCGKDEEKLPGIDEAYVVNQAVVARSLNPNGIFQYPVPIDGRYLIQRGYTEIDEHDKQHNGEDVINGQLDHSKTWLTFPVLSIGDGNACLNPKNRQGTAVFITHNVSGRIIYSYYGHLDKYFKKIPNCLDENGKPTGLGIFVDRGQIIGYAGATGMANPNLLHLHFSVSGSSGANFDAYDVWNTREFIPNITGTNGKYCGPKTLWVNCPVDPNKKADLVPTVVPIATLAPVETVGVPSTVVINKNTFTPAPEPTVAPVLRLEDLDPYNPAERARWAELAQKKILDTAWKFVNDLTSGTGADLEDAYNLQIPESLESARLKDNGLYGHKASMEILEGCSLEMDPSLTRDVVVSFPVGTGVPRNLDEVSYLNYQQGYQRERVKVFISLTHNRADAHGTRLGFKRFDVGDPYTQPYITFEVVGKDVYIAEPRFCTYENSTLRR